MAMYGFDMKLAIVDDTVKGEVKGGIYENLIADMLIKRGYKLNYYRSQDNSVEIEFLITDGAKVVPIEVKANNGSTISLNQILKKKDIPYGYKFIAGNMGVSNKKIVMPLYMAMFL